MAGLVQGLHVLDVHDTALGVHKGYGERDQCVLHIEPGRLLTLEYEEHTRVLSQLRPLHEPTRLFGARVGDLDRYLDPLTTGFDDAQSRRLRRFGLQGRGRSIRRCGLLRSPGWRLALLSPAAAGYEEQRGKQEHQDGYPSSHSTGHSTDVRDGFSGRALER